MNSWLGTLGIGI